MFQGEVEHSLDDKNRVVLPASLRKGIQESRLSEGFTIVDGRRSQCLEMHPKQDWEDRIAGLMTKYSDDNEDAEDYFRDVLSSVQEITLDKNYRFVLSEASKKAASIDRDVVFVGVWKKIEIWDRERWEARKKERAGKQTIPRPDF